MTANEKTLMVQHYHEKIKNLTHEKMHLLNSCFVVVSPELIAEIEHNIEVNQRFLKTWQDRIKEHVFSQSEKDNFLNHMSKGKTSDMY